MKDALAYGDLVAFMWGVAEVHGTVAEIYGPKDRRQVVIALTPKLTGYVVIELTTLVLSIEDVHRIVTA